MADEEMKRAARWRSLLFCRVWEDKVRISEFFPFDVESEWGLFELLAPLPFRPSGQPRRLGPAEHVDTASISAWLNGALRRMLSKLEP